MQRRESKKAAGGADPNVVDLSKVQLNQQSFKRFCKESAATLAYSVHTCAAVRSVKLFSGASDVATRRALGERYRKRGALRDAVPHVQPRRRPNAHFQGQPTARIDRELTRRADVQPWANVT